MSVDQSMSTEDVFEAAFEEAAAARTGNESVKDQPTAEPDEPNAQQEAEPQHVDEVAELRKRLTDTEHRERSSAARISSFHRKYNEGQAQIAELQQRLDAMSAPKADATNAEADEDDESLAKEMPELSRSLDRMVARRVAESVGEVKRQVQQVEQGLKPIRDAEEERSLRAEMSVVENEFPGWREIVYGKDFTAWLESKPDFVQAGFKGAETGRDGLEILRMYDRDKGTSARVTAPAADSANAAAKKLDRMERSVGLPTRNAPAKPGGMPDQEDFDANFEFFAQQRRRKA